MMFRILTLLALAFCSVNLNAAPAKNLDTRQKNEGTISPAMDAIDLNAVKKAYAESDWDRVKIQLESYLRLKGDENVVKEERIFAYKYLGVIYAADTLTTARAESYFHRLLDLSPEIDIVDLFASKRVNELFKSIKEEHQGRLQYTQKHDEFGRVLTSPQDREGAPQADLSKPRHQDPRPLAKVKPTSMAHPWLWWTAGTAVAVGAVAGVYVLMSQSEPSAKVIVEDVNASHVPAGQP